MADRFVGRRDAEGDLLGLGAKGATSEGGAASAPDPGNGGLDEGAFAVAVAVLPGDAAVGGNLGDMALSLGAAVGCTGWGDGGSRGRNDDIWGRARWSRRADRGCHGCAIVSSICNHRSDPASGIGDQLAGHRRVGCITARQGVGQDLAGSRIDADVQLPPVATLFAMLLAGPFSHCPAGDCAAHRREGVRRI